MDLLLNIPITNWVYPVMYLAAFMLGICYLIVQAKKHQWPMNSIILMLGCTVLAAVIGSKLVMIPSGTFFSSVISGELPAAAGKSFLGGVAGGAVGMLIAIHILRLPLQVADKAAIALPVSMAIGRVGCLFAGCCFGSITKTGWGITYSAGSPAHITHVHSGLIEPEALVSLAVHPVPVYEVLFCLIILVIIFAFKNHLKMPGSQMLAILTLYSFLRFGGEFYRHQFQDGVLSTAQIATALAGISFLFILMLGERRPGRVYREVRAMGITTFMVLSTLWISVIVSGSWFSSVEIILLWGTLITLTVYLALDTITRKLQYGRFYQPLLISAVPLFYFVANPVSVGTDSTSRTDSRSNSHFRYGLGFFGGNFGAWDIDEGSPVWGDDGRGCDHPSYPDWDGIERPYRYGGAGASVEYVGEYSSTESITAGVRAIIGQSYSPIMNTNRRSLEAKKESILMFNPYMRRDWKYVGFGIGAHVGTSPTRRLISRVNARGYLEAEIIYFEPMASIRLFPRKGIFIESRFQDADPGSFPLMRIQNGVGVGFSSHDQYGSFRAGFSDWGYYVESDIPVSNHVTLNGRVGFARVNSDLQEAQNHLSFGLRYKP